MTTIEVGVESQLKLYNNLLWSVCELYGIVTIVNRMLLERKDAKNDRFRSV